MSPYIVTTRNERVGLSAQVRNMHGTFVVSRRAVATLDKAQNRAHHEVLGAEFALKQTLPDERFDPFYDAALTLPESGGTIGPLPDGTIVRVAPTTRSALLDEVGIHELLTDAAWPWPTQLICDAFNARQSADRQATTK